MCLQFLSGAWPQCLGTMIMNKRNYMNNGNTFLIISYLFLTVGLLPLFMFTIAVATGFQTYPLPEITMFMTLFCSHFIIIESSILLLYFGQKKSKITGFLILTISILWYFWFASVMPSEL